MKVAKSFLDQGKKLNFAVASKAAFTHDVSEFGLDGSSGELPLVTIRTAKGDKYAMAEEFSWVKSNGCFVVFHKCISNIQIYHMWHKY